MIKKILESAKKLLFHNRFMGYHLFRLNKYLINVSKSIKPGESLLDIGAGECQYKNYFRQCKYTSQDLCIGDKNWNYDRIDIKSEIYDIPVADGSFDNILCTQVLEHLKYPHKAFGEFNRILKNGGKLLITCPQAWEEHQKPHCYFSFSQFALKMLAEENGFRIISIEKEGGKFIFISSVLINIIPAMFYQTRYHLMIYPLKIILYPINFLIGFTFYFLDYLDFKKDLLLLYECVFVKKESLKKQKNLC